MSASIVKIAYGDEAVVLTCDLTQASAPLVVDGVEIGVQTFITATARHRLELAVCLAAQYAWPEACWPDVFNCESNARDGWPAGCGGESAWNELAYERLPEVAVEACDAWESDRTRREGAVDVHVVVVLPDGSRQEGYATLVPDPDRGYAGFGGSPGHWISRDLLCQIRRYRDGIYLWSACEAIEQAARVAAVAWSQSREHTA